MHSFLLLTRENNRIAPKNSTQNDSIRNSTRFYVFMLYIMHNIFLITIAGQELSHKQE